MLLYHKYAINDRQHLIKFIILLLLLTRKEGNAFGFIQDIFPKTCNMSSGVSTYIERGMLKYYVKRCTTFTEISNFKSNVSATQLYLV